MTLFGPAMAAAAFAFPVSFSHAAGSDEISRSVMLISAAIMLVFGGLLCAGGLLAYLRKVRGAYRPRAVWKAVSFASGGLGLIILLGGILSALIYLATPMISG